MRLTNLVFGSLLALAIFPTNSVGQPTVKLLERPSDGMIDNAKSWRAFCKSYPILSQRKDLRIARSEDMLNPSAVSLPLNAGKLTTNRISELKKEMWGNIVYANGWSVSNNQIGMYSFNPSEQMNLTPVGLNKNMEANGGGAFIGNKFYFVNFNIDLAVFIGEFAPMYYEIDADDWGTIVKSQKLPDGSCVAVETALDKNTGTVYGEFYTADYKGLEIGKIDYTTLKRTTIGSSSLLYVAMGVTNEGKLYGIAKNGNLYQISTVNGAPTFIGRTGVQIEDKDKRYYGQTGEIDQTTNTFYWASIDSAANHRLYTVNLTNGSVTHISDFQNGEQMYAMQIPDPAANAGAPAKASELSISFDKNSTSGTLTFRAPSTNYAGDELSGVLDYEIAVNDEKSASGKINTGETKTIPLRVKEGKNKFTVTTSNSYGVSPKAIINKWIGNDIPAKPSKSSLSIDSLGKATVSWVKVKSGNNNGYVANVSYNIYRLDNTDTLQVGSNLTDTVFQESLPKRDIRLFHYGIEAINGANKSSWSVTNGYPYGDVYKVPYKEDFAEQTTFPLFTVVDGNHDNNTWKYDNFLHMAQSVTPNANGSDDWLISPPVLLEEGKNYVVSVDAANGFDGYKQKLEIKLGDKADTSSLSTTILPQTELTSTSFKTFEKEFIASKTGNYYVGIHDLSEAGSYSIEISKISIIRGVDDAAPDSVTNFIVNSDSYGGHNAEISFKAPVLTSGGKTLNAISSITLSRNNKVINEKRDVAPGQVITINDQVTGDSVYTYTVIAYNSYGRGVAATRNAFIGMDTPLTPSDGMLYDNTNSVTAKWSPAANKGVNGGYVNPNNVKYVLYNIADGQVGSVVDTVTGTSRTIPNMNTSSGSQRLLTYALKAVNKSKLGNIQPTQSLVLGTPYALPFKESFANGKVENSLCWLSYPAHTYGEFYIYTNGSSDDDGGCVSFQTYQPDDCGSINTGKISLEGATRPQLLFDYFYIPENQSITKVLIQKADQTTDTVLTITPSSYSGDSGWKTVRCDLSKYLNQKYIVLKLWAYGSEGMSSVYYDNIRIQQIYSHDLKVTLDAAKRMTRGHSEYITAYVENAGDTDIDNYELILSKDDNIFADTLITDTISPLEKKAFKFYISPSVADNAEVMTLKAETNCIKDENPGNDSDVKDISLVKSKKPTVINLTAKSVQEGVELSWQPPVTQPKTVTENFDSYEPWSNKSFGYWLSVDEDGGANGPLLTQGSYPGQGEPVGFLMFNLDNIEEGLGETLPARSGHQCAAAVYSMKNGKSVNANDWLISPELSGKAQSIRFYVSNYSTIMDFPETFEVMASSTNNTVNSFVRVGDVQTARGGTWHQVTVPLNDGTRYFAIHRITEADSSFLFRVDDVRYEATGEKPVLYRFYSDGVLAGTTDKLSYIYKNGVLDDNHIYAISAVYGDGDESEAVAIGTSSAIEDIMQESSFKADVYSVDGRRVKHNAKSLEGLAPGIYIINGKKVLYGHPACSYR